MAAGGMTKSNVIGCIGGQKFPAVVAAFQAFEKGAKAVNPKVTVKTVYLNSWEDQSLGKEAANSLIAQKADLLIHNADQAGKGMFDAAKAAKGVLVFGTNRDQNNVAPDLTLGSAVIEMPHIFVEFARGAQDNNFQSEIVPLTMANQSIGAHWNPKLKSKTIRRISGTERRRACGASRRNSRTAWRKWRRQKHTSENHRWRRSADCGRNSVGRGSAALEIAARSHKNRRWRGASTLHAGAGFHRRGKHSAQRFSEPCFRRPPLDQAS
jgi:hypothetical protein